MDTNTRKSFAVTFMTLGFIGMFLSACSLPFVSQESLPDARLAFIVFTVAFLIGFFIEPKRKNPATERNNRIRPHSADSR